ncbi:hypothetical protein M422DRAFT_261145 [Sphaerobolus stellatus SS14]|uniref:Uncharacterized protein n=1 Tax=Sphaerobolus stellatus (strain SS14) TaxID=990650 RepID=A0A0C9VFR1_SPHS4|nr:hypothetical protein M422DRAFT_261145 [Sphaerobolus stellatus SS14]
MIPILLTPRFKRVLTSLVSPQIFQFASLIKFIRIGTGIKVFGIVPVRNNNQTALSITNVTFVLDGQESLPFVAIPPFNGSVAPSFNYSVPLFIQDGLENGSHILVIMPALGSMLFLDSINITRNGTDQATIPGGVDSQTPTDSKKSVTTFAVAIGVTVGVLGIVAVSTFISIFYRRLRSAKREKIEEAREASLRPPSPEMRGIHTFIPRYFPGTNRPASVTSNSSGGSTGSSSMGPSHGLSYPLAPDDAPSRPPRPQPQPQPQIQIQAPVPLAIALRAPVARMSEDDYNSPPSYSEVHTTPLVLAPAYTPSSSLQVGAHSSISSSLALSDMGLLSILSSSETDLRPPPPIPEDEITPAPPLSEDEITPAPSMSEIGSATSPISAPVSSRHSAETSRSSPSSSDNEPSETTRPPIPLTLPQ